MKQGDWEGLRLRPAARPDCAGNRRRCATPQGSAHPSHHRARPRTGGFGFARASAVRATCSCSTTPPFARRAGSGRREGTHGRVEALLPLAPVGGGRWRALVRGAGRPGDGPGIRRRDGAGHPCRDRPVRGRRALSTSTTPTAASGRRPPPGTRRCRRTSAPGGDARRRRRRIERATRRCTPRARRRRRADRRPAFHRAASASGSRARGVDGGVTLDVGPGTFRPSATELADHRVEPEERRTPEATAAAIARPAAGAAS